MVVIDRSKLQQEGHYSKRQWILAGVAVLVVYYVFFSSSSSSSSSSSKQEEQQLRGERVDRPNTCSYQSLDDLSEPELHPVSGERHMIQPPVGGKISLVCCATTVGPLTIVAHHQWAPLGAKRFMEMVTTGYFQSGVPLMRCIQNSLCQFGLNSDPTKLKDFGDTIDDDPNWLPEGPDFRENEQGVKRFAAGYLAYAGAGKHSRNKQLIVALNSNGPLAGGSPWEVPWGELVGSESFTTLSKIYTGYGDKGPGQGRINKEGASEAIKQEFPLLDYITSCQLIDEQVQEIHNE
jgi:cyclophilin family peptidyl-prolyl cis-trans isomerase